METGSAGHELVVVVNPISVPAMSIPNFLSIESPPLPIESRSPYITKSGYECKKPARFIDYKPRDQVLQLEDHRDIGWLRVDMRPIKHALSTHASKWIWTFTKYLSDQVTSMLKELDEFLKRTEPEIEGITGEERDTASFMKMMRLFNEVSAQQHKMEGKFAAMHRTVLLVKKYGQKLPEATETLFEAAPHRWNSLRTKVSLAKQRLGPRIQSQSDHITKDLTAFADRVLALHEELESSDVYSRDCAIKDAWHNIDNILRRLEVLETEAHDLKELQELLEANIVNFDLLKQCHSDLTNLKELWETVRIIDLKHSEWKRHRWQKVNTELLHDAAKQQLEQLESLPDDVFTWDVYMGIHAAVTDIQSYLPLIDDLSNPAMRTRHWKQLVRVTGGAVQIDNETLKKMTLGELLSLGLQQHVDDVRAIVQRAIKDLSIEQSLKTYEEVWLSKKFELCEHARNKAIVQNMTRQEQEEANMDAHSELSENTSQQRGPLASRGHMRAASRVSTQSSLTRTRKTSISSLPISLIHVVGEENGKLLLLTKTAHIFDELENHQVALQAMQSSSAAGSFQDEVFKWQKQLQMIEAVMTVWLDVQRQWTELEEVRPAFPPHQLV
ncbi:Dynein heavy chain 9, axonemal [Lamellibrachia satsuma]|nr:Dynein heavy chain 9, axonemal [Lamellibrachia satsuma]